MKLPKLWSTKSSVASNTLNSKEVALANETCSKTGPKFGIRHFQCFLIFCGLSAAYALRVNLSVAIVAMTDKQATNPNFDEFNWNEKTKSLLLSSFFWGYVCTQVPAGHLAHRFGGKIMLLSGVFMCSFLTILIPTCARLGGWKLVCAVRVMQGLSQGFVFPSTHTIISKWAPVEERGSLTTYSYVGSQFGTVLMLATSGVMASSPMGWPSIFYISGSVGLLWAVVWFIWGASSPSEYTNISIEEKKYIESSLGFEAEKEAEKPKYKTPWVQIFTSVPFWVLMLTHCSNNFGFWTLLTEIPSYMKNILNLDIKKNAVLSALPYATMFVLSFVCTGLQSMISKRNCMPLSVSRKLFNTIGQWVPMLSLIALAYMTASNTNLAIALLSITVGMNSATYLGFQVNHIDLSPNFAGILMGMTNCVANIMSITAPLIVGLIVKNEKDPQQWRIIFFIAAGLYFVGNLSFLLLGKFEKQPWNDPETEPSLSKKRNSTFVESQH